MSGEKKDIIRESNVTYDDYAAMPDDGNRYEVSDGVLELMSPAPTISHQFISAEMLVKMKETCQNDYIIITAPFDLILSKREIRQPDLAMIHRSRMDILSRRGVEGAPDLIVEILSPFSIRRDKVQKRSTYAKYGVPEYWIVDPGNASLERYILIDGRYDLVDVFEGDEPVRSERLPCVAFSMRDIMSQLPDIRD